MMGSGYIIRRMMLRIPTARNEKTGKAEHEVCGCGERGHCSG